MASPRVATRSHNFLNPEIQVNLEMDAAQALLGVIPEEPVANTTTTEPEPIIVRRPRSDSAGLDALADLASLEQSRGAGAAPDLHRHQPLVSFSLSHEAGASASDDGSGEDDDHDDEEEEDDVDSMILPVDPPSRRRPRSASNPEGMDRWDPLGEATGRRHFVLPASILEEELAEVSEAMKKQGVHAPPNAFASSKRSDSKKDQRQEEEEEVDEASLTPDELLRRARSRLLEDLSEGNMNGEKGELMFPHLLKKYQEVYNMNGRIGIYTAAERAAIIAKFQRKRTRRVWNKKIRYGCRKSLADRRLRVKGRFVKRSEQEQLARMLAEQQNSGDKESADEDEDDGEDNDTDMLDVGDTEANFSPTPDSPFRRLRRHTIT